MRDLKISDYFFDYQVDISQDLIIPKAQDAKASVRQVRGSLFILRDLLRVLSAVEFDHQQLFEAAEVNDIRSDRILAAKLDA